MSLSTLNATNDKLNINTSSAKGLEKAIGVIAAFIIDAQNKTNQIVYGKYALEETDGNAIQRALDKGILNILDILLSVDFCNLLNYGINQIPGGKPFDPNERPIPSEPIARKKWQIQNAAFEVQKFIDDYKASYGDANNPESQLGLYNLIQNIKNGFSALLATQSGFNDPDIKAAFPEVSIASNYIENVLSYFDRYGNITSINVQELQKILSYIDKIRAVCQTLQSLNSVSGLIASTDFILGGKIQEDIAKINKLIQPTKAVPLLRNLLKTCNNIISVAQKVTSYINTARVFIRLFLVLLKVFSIIRKFLFGVQIPNVFTTVGVSAIMANVSEDIVGNKGINKLAKRLEQINFVLNLMAIFATSLVAGMQDIIKKLTLLLANIDSCNTKSDKDNSIKEDIKNTIKSLENAIQPLQEFLDQYNSASEKAQKQFGEYTIEIVNEQLADEGISIRRRYGIARGSNGYIAVQSTPTFASLDQIIVNEVKVLLVSKGLVKSSVPTLSPNDLAIVLESSKFLGEETIDLGNLEISLEGSEFESDDTELGLNEFSNNLPGGKALRKRARKLMEKNNKKLAMDLKDTDPGGKYTSNIIKQKESESQNSEKNQQIEDLEEEKKKLLKTLALKLNPIIAAATIKKIKDIDNKIKALKNG